MAGREARPPRALSRRIIGLGGVSAAVAVGTAAPASASPNGAPAGRRRRKLPGGGGTQWTPPPQSSPGDQGDRLAGFTAASYDATRLPGTFEHHLASRFSGGWTPALGQEMAAAGGPRAWFTAQLAGGPDTFYAESLTWWEANHLAPIEVWQRGVNKIEQIWEAVEQYQRWALVRRVHSERQVLEAMADFWENLLHVPTAGEAEAIFRMAYGRGVRDRALGKFSDLLTFAITHPAMGAYLNLATSTAKAPNEDLARELLEVHTVGTGNFTEDDVVDSARILSGYRVDIWSSWTAWYDKQSHATGPVRVLDFSHPNSDADGQAVAVAYLHHLARHPLTARRLVRRLAVRFVGDQPSAALIDSLTKIYLVNDTAIAPVLAALVDSAEFAASVGVKVRLPEEDVVATYRALGARILAPEKDTGAAAHVIVWQAHTVGLAPFRWPRPDGRPDRAVEWSSTSRVLRSFEMHQAMAGGWWPSRKVSYRRSIDWLPEPELRFDALVDHLARTVLGKRSTDRLLKAACEATECDPDALVNAAHPVVGWRMTHLFQTLLDHPDHMTR